MDDEPIEPEYVRGFNEGYMLTQHKPELAEKLAQIDSDFVRLVGFKAGREQYQAEQLKTRLPSWLKGERPARPVNAPTKEKGRDVEPDKG